MRVFSKSSSMPKALPSAYFLLRSCRSSIMLDSLRNSAALTSASGTSCMPAWRYVRTSAWFSTTAFWSSSFSVLLASRRACLAGPASPLQRSWPWKCMTRRREVQTPGVRVRLGGRYLSVPSLGSTRANGACSLRRAKGRGRRWRSQRGHPPSNMR